MLHEPLIANDAEGRSAVMYFSRCYVDFAQLAEAALWPLF